MGWLPDLPDKRDSTLQKISSEFEKEGPKASPQAQQAYNAAVARISKAMSMGLPEWVDNRAYCSPVEDQGPIGSCTAHAGVSMIEYMERRFGQAHIDASRLFLYKVSRRLGYLEGDQGAYLRDTMKALVAFGVPPEEWWPYDVETMDYEPDGFLYSYAQNYKAVQYLRLDGYNQDGKQVLENVKGALSAGFTAMFGFPVYSSMSDAPLIPRPTPKDKCLGGHAVLAVGYCEKAAANEFAKNCGCDQPVDVGKSGALLIQNSWGTNWGCGGFGWLPFEYVEEGLAVDFWTCLSLDWMKDAAFKE